MRWSDAVLRPRIFASLRAAAASRALLADEKCQRGNETVTRSVRCLIILPSAKGASIRVG